MSRWLRASHMLGGGAGVLAPVQTVQALLLSLQHLVTARRSRARPSAPGQHQRALNAKGTECNPKCNPCLRRGDKVFLAPVDEVWALRPSLEHLDAARPQPRAAEPPKEEEKPMLTALQAVIPGPLSSIRPYAGKLVPERSALAASPPAKLQASQSKFASTIVRCCHPASAKQAHMTLKC